MPYHVADSIDIDTDEGRFRLIIEAEGKTFTFDIHGAASDLYEAVKRKIEPWWTDGETVRSEFERRRVDVPDDPDSARRFVFACNPEVDLNAYLASDPKSPGYHSIHADIWDAMEGK
jgi:hypothetical protein